MATGPPSFDPETAENAEQMEQQFAVKAVQQAETYWSLLERMKGSELRLTKLDDEIFEDFRSKFPDFDPAATLDEGVMKSPAGKEQWRNFMMPYAERVDDYNFGTLLRTNPKYEYGEKETIFSVRLQFYAIEIARNRAGLNDWIHEKASKGAKA